MLVAFKVRLNRLSEPGQFVLTGSALRVVSDQTVSKAPDTFPLGRTRGVPGQACSPTCWQPVSLLQFGHLLEGFVVSEFLTQATWTEPLRVPGTGAETVRRNGVSGSIARLGRKGSSLTETTTSSSSSAVDSARLGAVTPTPPPALVVGVGRVGQGLA